MNIEQIFRLGMKRELGVLVDPLPGLPVLNLGAGNSHIPGTTSLDFPTWDASRMPIPHADSSVGGIYAFHFLEHLTGAQAIALLMEAQRVLAVGAPMTIVVPHRLGAIAFQDLDHKSFWTEESWKTLFTNPHYDKNRELPWKFDIKFNAIIGIVERNLALMTQLVRTE